jgi:hypothetical protein
MAATTAAVLSLSVAAAAAVAAAAPAAESVFTKLASRSLLSRCGVGVVRALIAGLEVGVGVGVGPLVWFLLSDLRVAGAAGALSWAEPEAKWPKEVLTPGMCANVLS